jgi:predicted dehydrogenase
MTPPRDALEVTRIIDAAYRSAETGEAVRLA